MATTKLLREVSISYRTTQHEAPPSGVVKESQHVASYLREHVYDSDTLCYNETFYVLYLNRANSIIGYHQLSSGGMTATVADVRILFTGALLAGATGIIVSHNHPSGNNVPSEADKQLTAQIAKAGKLLCIDLLDHVIVTEQSYYSFADSGQL